MGAGGIRSVNARSRKEDSGYMEIRLLYGNELQWAVNTANEVFEACVRPYAGNEEVQQYCGYVNVEHLWQEMSTGKLYLWGAFENGQMCAVSAMQNIGHITMLYVKPYYSKRRIGTELVNHMCSYAAAMLHIERVTIWVMPMVASYFYHTGFTLIQGCMTGGAYVPLERRIWSMQQGYPVNSGYGMQQGYPNKAGGAVSAQMPSKPEVTYPTKKVSAKCIIALTAGVFLFITAVITGITVHHMVKDGIMTYDQEETEAGEELPEGFGEAEEI